MVLNRSRAIKNRDIKYEVCRYWGSQLGLEAGLQKQKPSASPYSRAFTNIAITAITDTSGTEVSINPAAATGIARAHKSTSSSANNLCINHHGDDAQQQQQRHHQHTDAQHRIHDDD